MNFDQPSAYFVLWVCLKKNPAITPKTKPPICAHHATPEELPNPAPAPKTEKSCWPIQNNKNKKAGIVNVPNMSAIILIFDFGTNLILLSFKKIVWRSSKQR